MEIKRYEGRYKKDPKIVVIGGGTGISIILRGIKKKTKNITAIVTVADDGGSSGSLREDLGMLPPGDIRACLLALANTEPAMEKLFNFRFKEGKFKDQNMGNLLIAAMNEIHGNFETAIRETSNVLAVTGKVLPMTLENVQLCAILENGKTIKGESKIPLESIRNSSKIDRIYMEPKMSYPLEESVEAIENADLIVLGPGSLYTSVIPNLLVNHIVDKIKDSKAPKVYIGNVMTQPGETGEYTLLDHVNAILKHSDENILNYVIGNNQEVPEKILTDYIKDGSKPILIREDEEKLLKEKGIQLISSNLVDIEKGYIRHDAEVLSDLLMEIIKKQQENKD